MHTIKNKLSYLNYFILCNFFFFALQIILIYSKAGHFIAFIKLPWGIYKELLQTFCIHLTLYLLLSLGQTILLISVLKRSWHYLNADQWLITIWLISVCIILSANSYYFPLSQTSKILSPFFSKLTSQYVLCGSTIALALLVFNCLSYALRFRLLNRVFILLVLIYFIQSINSLPQNNSSSIDRPNIIIIGIDSLSPENINQTNMPFLYKKTKNGVFFANAISPLARTYPAWNSILTGLYVKHHHAEENLVKKNTLDNKKSIAWTLGEQGYYTIFATDDRRFNSLDKTFGFNTIIGPKLGVNDILLGSFNDFPLSNLLINFRISSWLFPYNYINRASFFSYYPETFNTKLEYELKKNKSYFPIFLAVHFTLPHWPYAWADSLPEQVNNEFSLTKRNALYQSALKKTDQQIQTFFTFLEKENYLSNSLLIFLSDHGETLYYPNSRLTNYQNFQGTRPSQLAEYFHTKTATDLDKSAGHGSDLLSPKQYHSLLCFYLYKNKHMVTKNALIKTRVALIDLAPTILEFTHQQSKYKMDGISLLKKIFNPQHQLPTRYFYVESGMFPNQEISKEKAMQIGKNFYRVNARNNELEIKPKKLIFFTQQKLYGIIHNHWVFALYPDKNHYIPVIQNLSTGEWTDELNNSFAKSTPALLLYKKLKRFYGKQLFLPLTVETALTDSPPHRSLRTELLHTGPLCGCGLSNKN